MSSPLKTPPIRDVPKLQLHVPVGRDYGFLLMQTKTVYDGLLEDKQAKLIEEIVEKQQVLEIRSKQITKKHPDQAVEFIRKAQAELAGMQQGGNQELHSLQTDYQQKLNSMQQSLEDKWRQEKTVKQGVDVKVLPHK